MGWTGGEASQAIDEEGLGFSIPGESRVLHCNA
jgi:hypothetical protein